MASKMKKTTEINRDNSSRAEAERLSNRIFTVIVITILYALLVFLLQTMSFNITTVNGAQAFIQILFWGSIVGAMVCAAIGAYKEKKSLFTYCGIFLYILWSMVVIQFCGVMGAIKAYILVYLSLAVILVMALVFSVLVEKGKMEKRAKTVFVGIAIAFFVIFCLIAIGLRFSFFGLF